MDIWLKTLSNKTIQQAMRFGVLSGIMTTPALFADEKRDVKTILKDLLHFQEGPVAVQVLSHTIAEIVQEGQNLFFYSNRIIVQIPVSKNGLEALYLLARQGIPTMATAVFNSRQVLMAALAGANYIVPHVSTIASLDHNPWLMFEQVNEILKNYRLTNKIIADDLHSVDHVLKCAEMGVQAITIDEKIFEHLTENEPLAQSYIEKCTNQWMDSHKMNPFNESLD